MCTRDRRFWQDGSSEPDRRRRSARRRQTRPRAELEDRGYRRFDCTSDDPVALAEATEAARRAIEQGECIVLPTDTVYGIGADAFDPDAVQRLLDAKMPRPGHAAAGADRRAVPDPRPGHRRAGAGQGAGRAALARAADRSSASASRVCGWTSGDSEGTVALRVPDHELAREILRGTGPMAVSSANLSGQPAALTCDEAIEQLGDQVSVYLDGGPLGGSRSARRRPSSTSPADRTGQVLRHGALSVGRTAPRDLPGPRGPGRPIRERRSSRRSSRRTDGRRPEPSEPTLDESSLDRGDDDDSGMPADCSHDGSGQRQDGRG